MIRHLPILTVNNKIKKMIVEKVDTIYNLLTMNNLITSENFNQLLKSIDDIIFGQYSITEEEKKTIISEVRNQIKHFRVLYND